jgi:hypothetical protein
MVGLFKLDVLFLLIGVVMFVFPIFCWTLLPFGVFDCAFFLLFPVSNFTASWSKLESILTKFLESICLRSSELMARVSSCFLEGRTSYVLVKKTCKWVVRSLLSHSAECTAFLG